MESSVLVGEAPALRGAILKLFGKSAVMVVGADYERVAALGGNIEVGLSREEGVRYNPRIARISLISLQEGEVRELELLRAVVWSTLRDARALAELTDDDIRRTAECVLSDEDSMETSVLTIRAAIALDTVRHLHMTALDVADKLAYLRSASIRSLLHDGSSVPSNLKTKLHHAVVLQERGLAILDEGEVDE